MFFSKVVILLVIGSLFGKYESSLVHSLVKRQAALQVCTPGICLNGGTCQPLGNTLATCLCPSGFSGIFCNVGPTGVITPVTTSVGVCTPNVCLNGGTCNQVTSNIGICTCASGFGGPLCTFLVPPSAILPAAPVTTTTTTLAAARAVCLSTSCDNGGTCREVTTNILICLCPASHNGPRCSFPTGK